MRIIRKNLIYIQLTPQEQAILKINRWRKQREKIAELGGFSRETARKFMLGAEVQIKRECLHELRLYLRDRIATYINLQSSQDAKAPARIRRANRPHARQVRAGGDPA